MPGSDASASAPTIAYISGTGRSGSTLLCFLLNSHPDMVTVGEMHAPPFPRDRPDDRMCSCGSRAKDCEFLTEIARRLEREQLPFDPRSWDMTYSIHGRPWLNRLTYGSLRSTVLEDLRDRTVGLLPGYRRALADLDTRNDRFVGSAVDIAKARVFVDANKDPIRIRFLHRRVGQRLKVIHLVRDPRGYAGSLVRYRTAGAGDAARTWRRVNENVERHLERIAPENWRRVTYESICADPRAALRELSEFLGVRPIEEGEAFDHTANHITGNKMSFDFTGTITLDQKWRQILSAADLESVTEQAGSLARRYGYDL